MKINLAQRIKLLSETLLRCFRRAGSKGKAGIFELAVRQCPLPVMLHADDGEVLHINEQWTHLTGYGHAQIPTIEAWTRLAYEERATEVAKYIQSLHSLHSPFTGDCFPIKTSSGNIKTLEFSTSPLGRLKDGRHCCISVAIDRTERAVRENELNLIKKALDCATNSVIITDREGTILYANDAVARTSGYDIHSILGKKPSVFKSGLHEREFYENMWRSLREGKTFLCEMTNRHKEGFLFHEEAMMTPILGEDQETRHIIAIKTDLTEKNNLQSELYHALDKALEASQAKSRLLARVSHELRTPMNGIMGMNQLLQVSDLEPDQKEMTEAIETCSRTMMLIIEDLLSITALESKNLSIDETAFDIQEAINRSMRQWTQKAKAKNLSLSLRMTDDLPEIVSGDEHRIIQVLSNLVTNAIKFSDSGNILIAVEAMKSLTGDTNRRICFSVIDEGVGVSEGFRSSLFEPFRQADESYSRKYGGLGLGLAISFKLVQAMNGELLYEPNNSKGSRFWFVLDLATPSGDIKRNGRDFDQQRDTPESIHILLVEDSRDNQIVICRMLRHIGYTVSSAYNGREALEQLAAESFDLVLMDCHMPVMDGLEATLAIRNGLDLQKRLGFSVPIIALTADVKDDFRNKCLGVGMNDFLTKPVSMDSLDNILRKWLPARPIELESSSEKSR